MADPVVLHVLEALEGGTARHLVDVVRAVDGFAHHVAVPSVRIGGLTDNQARARMGEAGATVHTVEMRRSPVTRRNARALLELRRLTSAIGADIVHGHSSIGGALARVVALTTRRRCVYTPNGVATGAGAVAIERALARCTTRIIAVSPSEAALLRERRIATEPRVVVIPNGIEIDAPPPVISLRQRLDLPSAAPLVGTVARLVPQKAPERFVAMAAAVHRARRDVQFVLIGDGPLRSEVEHAVEAADLHPVFHHLPELPDASAALGELDVFVLVSRFEGGPYTPLEAMRAATAVVLSDVVGNRDVVEPGRSGVLVPEHDTDAMATAVVELLADDARRAELGAAGRARVRSQFDITNTGRMLADVYGSLVAQPPRHL